MPKMYIVHELEPDETRRGGRGEQEIDVKAPIKFRASEIGCFIAEDESEACRLAAEAVERPGKFVATRALYQKIELGRTNEDKVATLEAEVKKERKRARKNARRGR
jgi:hypothetical protein